MRKIISIILCLLLWNISYANDIEIIKKGEAAKADGFWVSSDQMKQFREINEKLKLAERKIIKLEDLQVTQTEQIDFYKKRAERYQLAFEKEQTRGFWSNVMYFGLGTLITGGIAIGMQKALK